MRSEAREPRDHGDDHDHGAAEDRDHRDGEGDVLAAPRDAPFDSSDGGGPADREAGGDECDESSIEPEPVAEEARRGERQ